MAKNERAHWILNIENSATAICSELDSAVVNAVFERYGARNVDDLNPAYLPEVFSELYAIQADLQ